MTDMLDVQTLDLATVFLHVGGDLVEELHEHVALRCALPFTSDQSTTTKVRRDALQSLVSWAGNAGPSGDHARWFQEAAERLSLILSGIVPVCPRCRKRTQALHTVLIEVKKPGPRGAEYVKAPGGPICGDCYREVTGRPYGR